MNFPNQVVVGAVAVTIIIAGFLLIKKGPQNPSMEQVATGGMDEAIQNYIEQHPEVILQSVEKYQERKAGEMMAQLSANIKSKKADLEQKAGDPKVGPDAATVKIVEFFDYGCVFCRKMQPIMAKAIQNNPDVQVIFKEMPMFGEASTNAAKASLSVYKVDPSKYYQFHSALLKTQNSNVSSAAMETATSLGINADKLKQAMQDPELDKMLADNRKLATEIGVRGAPAFIINGELFIGLMEPDILQEKIDAAKGLKPGEGKTGGEAAVKTEAGANDNGSNGAPVGNTTAPVATGSTSPAQPADATTGEASNAKPAESTAAPAASTAAKPAPSSANGTAATDSSKPAAAAGQ